ncbi:MAG: thioredoxin domain-containing protein, partial [Myxococcota bacterium]
MQRAIAMRSRFMLQHRGLEWCFLLVLGWAMWGCKDPYSGVNTDKSSSKQLGSLQDVYKQKPLTRAVKGSVQRWNVPLGKAPQKGSSTALITLVEFSDFQCPYCSKAGKMLKELADTDKRLRVVFRHYPLSFHKEAHGAAQAAVEAQKQGKFWAYHDKLFANQRALDTDDLVEYAQLLGLSGKVFERVLMKETHKARVDADMRLGESVGVQGTPTVFLNGRRVESVKKPEIQAMIEDELERIQPLVKKGLRGDALYQKLIEDGKQKDASEVDKKKPVYEIGIGESPVLGTSKAPVTLVEFSDFQCP